MRGELSTNVVSKEKSVLLSHLDRVFENLEKEKKCKAKDDFRITEELSVGDTILKVYFC